MATLKISDLSVGDWVRTKDGNVTVDIISPLEVVVMNDYGKLCACKIEDIQPIPITAEILEKNGIHRAYEDDNYAIFRVDGLRAVKYSDGDWELSTPPVCRVDIKYIHQLQHALRLADLYKEINL